MYSCPAPDEFEVSIFGPGYGESIVLHLGANDWITVDSCIDPTTLKPVALAYLEELGVDASKAVRAVVATHWDDDHINGLSQLFCAAEGAKFVCSSAMTSAEFEELLATWRPRQFLPGGSKIKELETIFKELDRRKGKKGYPSPVRASSQKVIFERLHGVNAHVRSLSPSDAAQSAAIARFSELVAKDLRLPAIESNHASVVLSVRVGDVNLLLGGDLEVRADRSFGWLAVVDEHTGAAYDAFKASHHGSENGDNPEIWEKMLGDNPFVVVTPYVGGSVRLPSVEDCKRVLLRTSNAYLTAPPIAGKFRDRDQTVERTVREATQGKVHFIPGKFGHIRLRRKLAPQSKWEVQLFGDAIHMQTHVGNKGAAGSSKKK